MSVTGTTKAVSARRSNGTISLLPAKADAPITGADPAKWGALYKQSVEAEERLRTILPHVLLNPSAERALRNALAANAEVGEFLMRFRAQAEGAAAAESNTANKDVLWSVTDCCAWLGCKDDKVRSMVDEGTLPHVIVGGMLRIPSRAVRDMVEAGVKYGR